MKTLLFFTIISCLYFKILLVLLFSASTTTATQPYYKAIFNFGDSLSDTGNSLLSSTTTDVPTVGKLPYGMTFFRHPTGRFSDGRLIVDFIAEAFEFPYLRPYLEIADTQNDFLRGVNFAVGGATALSLASNFWTNNSLSVQLGWFKKFKASFCTKIEDCENFMKRSLFLMGEIGGNDYNFPFFSGGTIPQVRELVPLVVEAITNVTIALIEEGAVDLVVPGNLPIGCSVVYLTLFESSNKTDYDEIGCLKALNEFSKLHNRHLKRALQTLRLKYPHTNIIYGDYYHATMRIINAPLHYGFDKKSLFRACCGGGGSYNYNLSVTCGEDGSTVCEDPSLYVSWDGVHLTEAAYQVMAESLIDSLSLTTTSLVTI
ncbi:GDSL esterase/lipase At5g45910-like [Humulus lupulus]|uniref:GDSL esterase/lipase At5g45910-like n=1 Tax=Humulus lupulus TaxID=3486 RepID=UPI002B416283|nr:GDSL esterase/lipase At5g45910-like [Humulus lupulus]